MKTLLSLLLALLGGALLFTGCDPVSDDDDSASSDDDDSADDDDSVDDDDDAVDEPGRVIVLHGAYTGDATVASMDMNGGDLLDDQLGLPGSDWVLAAADGDPWLIGRYGADLVRRYDGPDFSAPTLEFSTEALANPQSLAVCDGKIFVSRYAPLQAGGGGDVAIYDLAAGGPMGTVDLSAYDEGTDGSPEPHAIVQDGEMLYVGLQRLDTTTDFWDADPVGKVLAIDCVTEQVVDEWDTGPNPFVSGWAGAPLRLLVKTNNGVEIIDTTTSTPVAIFDAMTEGGSVNGAAASGDTAMFVFESWADNRNTVKCYDVSDASTTDLESNTSWALNLKAAPDGSVWGVWRDHWATGDADPHGLAIYDPATCSASGDWIAFAAEPLDVAFLPGNTP